MYINIVVVKKEKIEYRTEIKPIDHSLKINVERWNNYLKLWGIKIFDLCQRKKDTFILISKNLDIYFSLSKEFRRLFFKSLNMSQNEIAKIIDSWQANVCKTIQGVHLLRIEQLSKLLEYTIYLKQDLIKNTSYLRIGSLTNIEINKTSLDFLKEFKSI